MTNQTARTNLDNVSRSLGKVHKSLLRYQKELKESSLGKELSPYEVLNLSLNDPDFEWLRRFSMMIVEIDEAVDDPDADHRRLEISVLKELRAIFLEDGPHPEIKKRIEAAKDVDPALWLELKDLGERLTKSDLN